MNGPGRPRVAGVTLGYQALDNGYPIVESLRSMLPLCDEIVANIGASTDGTREAVLGLGSPKIRLLEEPWDLDLREKGLLLSRETNRALDAVTGDWAVYLQADEVLHEDDLEPLRAALDRAQGSPAIDGLSFRYLHFYGSPWYYQDHFSKWYTRAVRAVRLGRGIRSVGDALKFRKSVDGRSRRLRARRTGVRVFHYGWARPPEVMLRKQKHFDRFWHGDDALARRYAGVTAEMIYNDLGNLRRFTGTHPAVMADVVARSTWPFASGVDRQWPRPLRLAWNALVYPLGRLGVRIGRWLSRSS